MRVYGNHCNAGTIHRNLQPEHVTAAKTIHREQQSEHVPVAMGTPPRKGLSHTLIRIEDWKLYASIKAAIEGSGVTRAALGRALDDPNVTAGGYHWRWE